MASLADSYHMVPRHSHDDRDFTLYPESSVIPATTAMDMHSLPAEAYSYPRSAHEAAAAAAALGSPLTYVDPSLYTEPNYMFNSKPSPVMYADDADMRASSVHSATSSTVSSPQSNPSHATTMAEWAHPALAIQGDYFPGNEYPYPGASLEDIHHFAASEFSKGPGYVDPSMIHHQHELARPMMTYDAYSQQAYPVSPALSASPQPHTMRHETHSPFIAHYAPYSPFQPPVDSHQTVNSFMSPPTETWDAQDVKEKQRCTCPDCGKVFKDLKAHMLTHQNERPEKCPIQTCEYHVKGFARKYDKNRHTLTHYKGTMVCGFCPGSGSAAEKSFNRADVFKRHLTAVHGVEQNPPNSRKKQGAAGAKKMATTAYPPDATGKCSTCSQTFANAQEFYEHLDDCVLRIVQQEDPAEAINAKRLAEVAEDDDVAKTLEKNNLSTAAAAGPATPVDEDEDDEMSEADEEDENTSPKIKTTSSPKRKGNPVNGVQKVRAVGMTHSRGGVAVATKKGGRKNRRDYPSSWGFDKGQMTMKKRVMTVFDGTHRLVKDDMMLSTDNEVRIRLSDGKAYVTDLDVLTLQRAEAYHNASPEEKASWVANDPTKDEIKRAQDLMASRTSPALTA